MNSNLSLSTALLLSFTGLTSLLSAQEQSPGLPPAPAVPPSTTVTEERTTTAVRAIDKIEGKIQRMEAEKNQLMLRTKHGKAPIPYNIVQATKFVDLDGKPVDPALLIPEVPVEVYYVPDASELVASKVIVQRYQAPLPGGGVTLTARETLKAGGKVIEETVKTTTLTQSGTIGTVKDGILTVLAQGDVPAVRYQYSETTLWVNAKGEPVPVALLKPGSRVKVSYTKSGEEAMAGQVTVLPPQADPVPAPRPEE